MSKKAITITESDILKRFDEMCAESLSPDVYSIWVDDIIPKLKMARESLEKTNRQLLLAKTGEILQAIYDSEINFAISSPLWDSGFDVFLGSKDAGYEDAKTSGERTFIDALKWLIYKVFEYYPESTFTVKYKNWAEINLSEK